MLPFFSSRKATENRHRSRDRGRKFGYGLRNSKVPLENTDHIPGSSYWGFLPVEIQVAIFAQCSIHDLLPLKLVCRDFNRTLMTHELSIARQYLRRRRHGTLPSTVINERTYTRNPEDDVVLLSDLFPPAKSAKGGYLYTFRYLHSLRRRQQTCARLSHYLANRVMDRFVTVEQHLIKANFPSKTERNLLFERGVANVEFNLVPLTYCALFFLESYASARKEHMNFLFREYEAGRLPVPIPMHVRAIMYAELQAKILHSPPFTDTSTLIATHHCMRLLVSYLRHTLVPGDFDGPADDRWIGGLLTISGFGRVVEFFSAEIGDGRNSRAQRRDFMVNFERDVDKHAREEMNPLIYSVPSDSRPHYPSPNEVWFDSAEKELLSRDAVPHDPECFSAWNGIPVLIGCNHCRAARGWQA